MRRASRGMSIIWVILAMTLALGASVTAFIQYLELASHEEWIRREEATTKELDKTRGFVTFRSIKAVLKLCGFQIEQEADLEKVLGLLKDRVETKKTAYKLPGKSMAFWETVRAAEHGYNQALARLETAKQFKKESEVAAKASGEIVAGYTQRKDQHISELQTSLQTITDAQTEDVRRYELRKSNLEAEIQKLGQAKTDLEKANRAELLDLSNKYNQVDTKLRELVKQEAIFHDLTEAQGRVVDPHQGENFAFITLGSRERLVRGLKFVVFVREPGGAVRWKGEVEVKEIFENTAKVSITGTVDRMDPIISGDLIYNPLYSPRGPRKIALAGDFVKTRYSKEQAIARIRAIGSVVQEAVTDETDFVIVGESYLSTPEYERAGLLSVPWRPHFEIFRFLGD